MFIFVNLVYHVDLQVLNYLCIAKILLDYVVWPVYCIFYFGLLIYSGFLYLCSFVILA